MISFDQELQQQLIIETRDLKKTRNFYQKLIQQERKSKGRVTASSCSNHSAELTAGSIKLCMCLKGPESKSMLLKLKSQFEELRSRVVFLECVKKYLEVETKLLVCLLVLTTSSSCKCFLVCLKILNVDRWGLEVSLLPSLAVYGAGSLDLQSSEDQSVLCFGTSKGKGSLQSGSPLGLMAYLYAR